jgi:hypothetical protein
VAKHVTVQCQPCIAALIASVSEVDKIVPIDFYNETPPADQPHQTKIELMELPYAFRTTIETIPRSVPYLNVPAPIAEKRQHELLKLGLNDSGLAIGVVWSSGDWNPDRSMDLALLDILSDVPGVQLFSLQRGSTSRQVSAHKQIGIVPVVTRNDHVQDTAATILNLDLIISVDTMLAHLAGALAKPVWTLLPFSADWRWMVARDDSPWYPTMRLFRQPRRGDWSSVMQRVRAELRQLAATR